MEHKLEELQHQGSRLGPANLANHDHVTQLEHDVLQLTAENKVGQAAHTTCICKLIADLANNIRFNFVIVASCSHLCYCIHQACSKAETVPQICTFSDNRCIAASRCLKHGLQLMWKGAETARKKVVMIILCSFQRLLSASSRL